ncbi:MAG: hypothetical protein LC785_08830 [Acidobacteria bacterium]|nr:hypothetical protein [Acidobacteriota bacterium]MCA1642038.1 hypothetical protein [Acidobacteriota bacterium]
MQHMPPQPAGSLGTPQPAKKGISKGCVAGIIKGQKQLVNIMLASRGKDFARHEDALYGILYSTELSK